MLVLDGEAGVGTSTLWLAAVDEARRRELRVLVGPAKAEHGLALLGSATCSTGSSTRVGIALAATAPGAGGGVADR